MPDGFPTTSWLVCAVAAFLGDYRAARRCPSRLEQYLQTVYGLEYAEIEPSGRKWKDYIVDAQAFELDQFKSDLPEIIELLSLIDITIAEDSSFGPSIVSSKTAAPNGLQIEQPALREFRGNELVLVRERVVEALVRGFSQVRENRLSRGGAQVAKKFVRSLSPEDVVITTNWDTVIEEAVRNSGIPKGINYGANVIRVDALGNELEAPTNGRRIYKLHGSFSWLHCPCCHNLYANEDLIVSPEVSIERWPPQRECDCGAELVGVLITPTYFKAYRLPQLAEIWRLAQKSLEESGEWLFVGYSMPSDDLWIRGMLLRALATRRRKGDLPDLTVVCRSEDNHLRKRFLDVFRGARVNFVWDGFAAYLDRGAEI